MNDRYIEECRKDLLQMNGGVSAAQSTSQNWSTKTDNKLKANLSIRELLDRVKNGVNEIKHLHVMFSSNLEEYMNRKKKFVIRIKNNNYPVLGKHFCKDHQWCRLSCTYPWNKVRTYYSREQNKTDYSTVNYKKAHSIKNESELYEYSIT